MRGPLCGPYFVFVVVKVVVINKSLFWPHWDRWESERVVVVVLVDVVLLDVVLVDVVLV